MDQKTTICGRNWIQDLVFTYVPDELKSLHQWVVWKYETRTNGKCESVPTKVPFDPKSHQHGSATNPRTWADYYTALDAMGKYEGLGFALAGPFVVIDLDKVRNPQTGQTEDWAEDIVSELNSYTELSPSGRGFHIWVKGKLSSGGNRKGRVEMYCEKRYMTVTGEHVEGTPLTIEERDLTGVHARMVGGELDPRTKSQREARPKPSTSSQAKFAALMAGHWQGLYKSPSEADLALCSMLARKFGPDHEKIDAEFRKSHLYREKWERKDYRERTIKNALQSHKKRQPVSEPRLIIKDISDIEAKKLDWLWLNKIPKGKLCVFAGNPDSGKTTVACDLIARLTTGKDFPDSKNENKPGHVLLLSAEDDPADTLRPRLEAAGADIDKVHLLDGVNVPQGANFKEREIALDQDIQKLEKVIERRGNIILVVIDPLTSYLGETDLNKEAKLRKALTPIKKLCERTGTTVLALSHLNKQTQQAALHRVSGATAMTGVPRAAWLFMRNPETKGEFIMMLLKNNVTKKRTGLKYAIHGRELTTGEAPYIVWGDEAAEDADRVLETANNPFEKKQAMAERFLSDFLRRGEKPAPQVLAHAKKEGIGERTIYDKKKEMGIQSNRRADGWYWALPENHHSEKGETDPDALPL